MYKGYPISMHIQRALLYILVPIGLYFIIKRQERMDEKWGARRKKRKKVTTNVDLTYRQNKEKLMYKRMARAEETEARLENEIRDRLKNRYK